MIYTDIEQIKNTDGNELENNGGECNEVQIEPATS